MAVSDVVLRSKQRVGTMLKDKWHLDGLLGVGGSASVFAATHRNQTRAAIKLLHPELSNETEFVKRFLREGYVANTVKHPGVVAVLDDDRTEDGLVFIVMELLDGYTLERRLRKEPILPTKEALDIAEKLLDILAAAHEKGIIHRDIKPANIFITSTGELKLLDFGIARISDASNMSGTTQQGVALGTPAFMSPEQARGRWDEVDIRSDVYSVGAMLWNLLSGKKPREAGTSNEELLLAMTQPIAPIESVAPHVSSEVAKVIGRALAFDAKERWPNAKTMQQALRLAGLLERSSNPPGEGEPFVGDVAAFTPSHVGRTSKAPTGPLAIPSAGASLDAPQTPPPMAPKLDAFNSSPALTPLAGPTHGGARPAAVLPVPAPLAVPALSPASSPDATGDRPRLSDARVDGLGVRPARARLSISEPSLPETEPIAATADVVPTPAKSRTFLRVFLFVMAFSVGFLGVYYTGHLDRIAWLKRYLFWLPSIARLRELLHLR